ncbi:MAG: hypothetical protein IIZ93_15800 [Acidaminococcaceae bacterium]|nr:hypothetical protein [Acidaminococcaceae bacterium]
MNEDEYRVYLVKLPASVRGACRLDAEGFASIYINDDLSPKAKKAVFRHEIRHIRRKDHHSGRNIREVEGCRARKSKF